MNKILVLLVSFSLLFTQFAPLAEAKGGARKSSAKQAQSKSSSHKKSSGSKRESPSKQAKSGNSSARVSASSTSRGRGTFSDDERSFIENMLNHSTDETLWGNANNVKRLLSLIKRNPDIRKQYKDSNLAKGANTAHKVCRRMLDQDQTGAFPAICKAHKQFTDYLYPGECSTNSWDFDDYQHEWVCQRPQKEKEGEKGGRNTPGKSDGDPAYNSQGYLSEKVEEKVDKTKRVPAMDEDLLALKNADLSYLYSSTVADVSPELKELVRALNQAARKGADMDSIMEEAVGKYLDLTYEGSNAFPPSYLSLIFKLYMDRVSSLQKGWNYVTCNTPASSSCKNKKTDKCNDIRSLAMEALLIQPRFRQQLSQGQWASISGIMKQNLSRFPKGSDEYYVELIRQGILKMGESYVQREMSKIVSKAAAEHKSTKEQVTLAFVGLLQISAKVVTAAEPLAADLAAQLAAEEAALQAAQMAVLESTETILSMDLIGPASATEMAGAGAEIAGAGAVTSVAIPIAITAVFVGGFIYALNDAYGYNKPKANAKRQMTDYVKRATSSAIQHRGINNPFGDELRPQPQMQQSQNPSGKTGNSVGQNPSAQTNPNSVPQPNPQGPRSKDDDPNQTCVHKDQNPLRGGLNDLTNRMDKATKSTFMQMARICGMKDRDIDNLLAMGRNRIEMPTDFFAKLYDAWEENPDLYLDGQPPMTCDEFLYQMAELEDVKDSFFNSQTNARLRMSIEYREINGKKAFYPVPELRITASDMNFSTILARFGENSVSVFISKLKNFMNRRGKVDFGPKLRLGGHEGQIYYENGNPKESRTLENLKDLGPNDYLHFHYEEIKSYQSTALDYKNRRIVMNYVCNHTILYPGSWLTK